MKIHKLSLIAVLAVATMFAYSPASIAQEKKEKGDYVKQRMDRLNEELKLTDAQKPKVEALLKEQSEKMRGLRDLPQEERREKGRTLREEETKKMKEILTAEQFAKYEKMPPPGRGQGGGGKKKKEGDAK